MRTTEGDQRKMSGPSIKLLICYHKKSPLFKDEILTPIHVGRALAKERMDPESDAYKWLMDNLIGDDTGENISYKNASYNEMTAIYWAWKNYDALGNPDYIGLMHYRRHFLLDENTLDVYNIRDFDEETYLDEINYSVENMQKLVDGCDFLPHIGKVNNVYKHYTENQRKEDIDLAREIILEKYPSYKSTMKKYFAGDYSNFCNMCIFRRELFFQYCEWTFSILEEFERRVDMSEKRFFISERLTGIFVAKLMENRSLKYKKLPIAFIDEPADIPVALCLNKKTLSETAVSIVSILRNSDNYHLIHFYLIQKPDCAPELRENIGLLLSKYKKCRADFIESELDPEYIPLYLAELLPKVNKCIFLSGNTIALHDIGEFYRICSVDDYYVAGVPQTAYNPTEADKKISAFLLVLNCKRMRMHHLSTKANVKRKELAGSLAQQALSEHPGAQHKASSRWSGNPVQLPSSEQTDDAKPSCGIELLNDLCAGEIGYIPWYLFASEQTMLDSAQLFYSNRRRADLKTDASWRPFLVYDRTQPMEYHQGIFASFWWENLCALPLSLQIFRPDLGAMEEIYDREQKEINAVRKKQFASSLKSRYTDAVTSVRSRRIQILLHKIKNYYQLYGLQRTFFRGLEKISGGRK